MTIFPFSFFFIDDDICFYLLCRSIRPSRDERWRCLRELGMKMRSLRLRDSFNQLITTSFHYSKSSRLFLVRNDWTSDPFFFKQLLINIFTNKTGPNWIDAAARWLDFVWDLQTFPLQQTCAFTVIPFLYQSISSQVQEALEPCRYWYSFLFLCLIDPQCPVCFPRDVFKVQQQGANKKKARSIHH